jgi:hypothetical protein
MTPEQAAAMRGKIAQIQADNDQGKYAQAYAKDVGDLLEYLDRIKQDMDRISDEMGLPHGIVPAEGEFRRMWESRRSLLAEVKALNERVATLSGPVCRCGHTGAEHAIEVVGECMQCCCHRFKE